MAEDDRAISGRAQAPSPQSAEETRGMLEGGLGSSRYKEYDIAPFAQMVQAAVPQELWSGVFFSWMSMKAHLQGLHGLDRTQTYATLSGDIVYATFLVVWQNADELAEWMAHGYPVEEMLRAMGLPDEDIHIQLVRDFS
jgi:hypothetical protein